MQIKNLNSEELAEFRKAYHAFQDKMLFDYGRVTAGMQDYFIEQWNETHEG